MSGSWRGRVRRARRWFVLGSGPLKRGSDRAQVAGRVVVALALLAAVPLALLAAGLTRGRLDAVAAAQAADRHEVRAVVLADGAGLGPARQGSSSGTTTSSAVVPAVVSWRARSGAHEATLLVPVGTLAGTSLPVWVDRRGRLTTAPLDRTSRADTVVVVALAVGAGLPLTVLALHCGLCLVLDVQRRHRWERDWARVEREWRARLG
jgi:hypothetical protein